MRAREPTINPGLHRSILAPAALGPLRLPPARSEFADGTRQSFAAAYGRHAEREPVGEQAALANPTMSRDHPEVITIPHAKFHANSLKTGLANTHTRTHTNARRHTDSVLDNYIRLDMSQL